MHIMKKNNNYFRIKIYFYRNRMKNYKMIYNIILKIIKFYQVNLINLKKWMKNKYNNNMII